jgi:hypothetical protein
MIDARAQLDRQYHEMRWRILSLAADFDRVERLAGGADVVSKDVRIANLKRCVEELLSTDPGRAERVQTILSDKTPAPVK